MFRKWMNILCGTALVVALLSVYSGCDTPVTSTDGGTDGGTGTCGSATCGADEVCDTQLQMCFKNCKDASFVDCDPGNTCDDTLSRCVCNQTDCAAEGASFGCHPSRNTCVVKCTGDDQCQTGETCKGDFCYKPNEQADECQSNTDCTDTTKTVCDTSATPKVCTAPPRECTADSDCTADPNKGVCTMDGNCVECTTDADCGGQTCDAMTNSCMGPTACTDTATCHEAGKKTYCPDGDKSMGCQDAPNAACDTDAMGSNADWETNIENSVGSIIHDVTIEKMTTDSCFDGQASPNVPCSSDGDCDSGFTCKSFPGGDICGKNTANGTVIVTFSYYNKEGKISTMRNSIVTNRGPGGIAENPSITTDPSNKVSGKIKWSLCLTNPSGSYGFFTTDTDSNPSNKLCYSP